MLASDRNLVTETIVGRADRIVSPRYEVDDFGRVLDRGLNDGEFVTSQPCDEVGAVDALVKAHGHGFQQFVADHVPKRIVDALEFVDVDIQHRQLLARSDMFEFLFQPLVKQCSVWQIGQRVIMCEMSDALLGARAFGDILVGRHPSAIRQRFVYDLN